jgi:AraC-like DNA-binding protein
MIGLKYHQETPSKELSQYIDAYWSMENITEDTIKFPVVPDGCIDIVWENGQIFLVGIMEIAMLVPIAPKDRYIGIRFRPGVIASLLYKDISQFNDQMIPLEEVAPTLTQDLQAILDNEQVVFEELDQLFVVLFDRITVEQRVLEMMEQIRESGGNASMQVLSDSSELSIKQLERLFVKHVGVTPKRFARIIRFSYTHKDLSQEGIVNLCSKVLERGYYDQAHFNREYKRLTGYTPTHDTMSIFYNT